MKAVTTDLEERQIADLDIIATGRISRAEHIRRAIDIYLSHPSIAKELAEKKEAVNAIASATRGIIDAY